MSLCMKCPPPSLPPSMNSFVLLHPPHCLLMLALCIPPYLMCADDSCCTHVLTSVFHVHVTGGSVSNVTYLLDSPHFTHDINAACNTGYTALM